MIMAKKATNKKDNLPMEEVLWKACAVSYTHLTLPTIA